MAPPPLRLILLLLLAGAASARPGLHFHPCRTLFISYTFTTTDLPSQISPEDVSSSPVDTTTTRSFTIYRFVRPLHIYSDPYSTVDASSSFPLAFHRPIRANALPDLPRPAADESLTLTSLGVTNSLRERAKDILVVVVGLLFGVGCGALTAATMYLAWSLLTNRYEICGSEGYGYEDEEDEIESPKKMGYVSIPPPLATPASPPVKEGYEGN